MPAPDVRKSCASLHAPRAPYRILLVEDDQDLSQVLSEALTETGFAISIAANATEMDHILERDRVDLIILDIMLPGEDGLNICRRLRTSSSVPIIMVTALDKEIDRVVGLEIGADDYLTKPFSSRELIARIRALLRRAGTEHSSRQVKATQLTFCGWVIDPATRQLHNPQGVKVQLTSAEFDLLLAFCQNANRILSREQLLELTHSGGAGPIERTIDVHIRRIRQKVETDPSDPVLIKTVRLGGYIFTATVDAK